MKAGTVLLAAVAATVALAGCGGLPSSAPAPTGGVAGVQTATTTAGTVDAPRVMTRTIAGLGPVLVNSKGMTLYMFVPDNDARVTCVGACAEVWPPLRVAAGSRATASGGAKAALLGSDADPSGGRVVTYAGRPLYTYVGDTAPGMVKGQGLDANGGLWYVLSPAGAVIHTKPSSAGS